MGRLLSGTGNYSPTEEALEDECPFTPRQGAAEVAALKQSILRIPVRRRARTSLYRPAQFGQLNGSAYDLKGIDRAYWLRQS
jgi:hypothetical protein